MQNTANTTASAQGAQVFLGTTRPTTDKPGPFTARELARLLALRSKERPNRLHHGTGRCVICKVTPLVLERL